MMKALMKKRQQAEGKADLTTVAIKKTTRDKLDNLGFDRHASYDSIINSLLEQRKEWKATSEMIAELAEDIKLMSDQIRQIHMVVFKGMTDKEISEETFRRLRQPEDTTRQKMVNK
jgi:hypothetical protein